MSQDTFIPPEATEQTKERLVENGGRNNVDQRETDCYLVSWELLSTERNAAGISGL